MPRRTHHRSQVFDAWSSCPRPATSSRGRGDELIRRYRLARVRLEGREATAAEAPRPGLIGG